MHVISLPNRSLRLAGSIASANEEASQISKANESRRMELVDFRSGTGGLFDMRRRRARLARSRRGLGR